MESIKWQDWFEENKLKVYWVSTERKFTKSATTSFRAHCCDLLLKTQALKTYLYEFNTKKRTQKTLGD